MESGAQASKDLLRCLAGYYLFYLGPRVALATQSFFFIVFVIYMHMLRFSVLASELIAKPDPLIHTTC